MALIRTPTEAVNVAASLNTTVVGGPSSHFTSTDSEAAVLITPAEQVRKHFRRDGWRMLSVEEQQWALMDQALNAHKYDWLREAREEENVIRAQKGKPPKKDKYPAHVEVFRMNKVRIPHHRLRRPSLTSRTSLMPPPTSTPTHYFLTPP
jgi:hypothetical protein